MIIGKAVLDRGTKAGIKNLTDSVETSDLEILKQADSDIDLTCDCGNWVNGPCGGSANGALFPPGCDCAPTEMLRTKTCTPTGCSQPACQCVPAAQCCTLWTLEGTPADSCGVNAQLNPHAEEAGVAPQPPGNYHHQFGCVDGQGLCSRQCGSSMVYACKGSSVCPDAAVCSFGCNLLSTNAIRCSNAPVNNNDNERLRQSKNYIHGVDSTICYPPTGVQPPGPCPFLPGGQDTCCKAYCKPGFILQGQECICPPETVYDFDCDCCLCPEGSVLHEGCPANECVQGNCPNGHCTRELE